MLMTMYAIGISIVVFVFRHIAARNLIKQNMEINALAAKVDLKTNLFTMLRQRTKHRLQPLQIPWNVRFFL